MVHSDPSSTGSTIIPCLRYRHARAAIGWLQRAPARYAGWRADQGQ
ncbi:MULTISPECIES: hypothetical protein [Stenotrophomonas]|nr:MULTISPECIES: hypothetical protein [Stenotrophomonas]